ncbi:hypothetical protein [Micromonospora thermarum]|uniref:Uncharacterized protein n=1 Tax=Micromonospora thermarum TaxID=2720024 RepID=A0ABX0Z4A8_9ACTN|nr:hypothetical protein [Micromonospora thermarum]NJP32627.1 hypothetical protein [Micromonospora thermarum]
MNIDEYAATKEQVQVAGVDAPLRVMIISTVYQLKERIRNYVRDLLEKEGIRVDLVFLGAKSWEEVDPEGWEQVRNHPLLTLYTLDGAEHRHPLRRVERVIVLRAPEAVLSRATRLTERVGPLRPLQRPAKALENGHRRVAGAFHSRIYNKAYKLARPSVLAKLFGRRLADVDFRTVDRIVATDVYAVTLGWRLARKHPHLVATTALDRDLVALHEQLRAREDS